MAKCEDHLGREFKSKTVMCHVYGININTFDNRIKSGMSLKEALLTPNLKPRNNKNNSNKNQIEEKKTTTKKHDNFVDQNGYEHTSFEKACKKYGITYSSFYQKVLNGMCPEDALVFAAEVNMCKIPVVDPFGNYFETIEDMCTFWNIGKDKYLSRIKQEHSQCAALGLIPIISMHNQECKFKDISVKRFAYIGCDGKQYFFCTINDDTEMILTKEVLYKFMEMRLKKEVSLFAVKECMIYD